MFRNEDMLDSAITQDAATTQDCSKKVLQEIFADTEKAGNRGVKSKDVQCDELLEKYGANLNDKQRKILQEDLLAVFDCDKEGMKKILDRDDELRKILTEALRDAGYRVEESYSGTNNLYGTNHHDHVLLLVPPDSDYGTRITKTRIFGEVNFDWSKVPPTYTVETVPA